MSDMNGIYSNLSAADLPNIKYKNLNIAITGNTCNLACRSCSSFSSSKWSTEEPSLNEVIPIKTHPHSKFYKDDQFLSIIKSIITDGIEVIQFQGGEPFVPGISKHVEFLKYLLTKGPENIKLRYITNTTTFPKEQFWEIWSKFKLVDIQLSVDGISDKFEYLRWPANWDSCYANMLQYNNRRNAGKIQLSVSHCVSIFSVMYVPEFIQWCEDQKLPKPVLSIVSRPSYYSYTTLPQAAKEFIAAKLTNAGLPDMASSLFRSDNHAELDKMKLVTLSLDKRRKQNFKDTFPELNDFLKIYE
jgi:MoaA/NifB/PqqE/SkfB family radical SAM enzyme